MASVGFLERFKDRSSSLKRSGELDLSDSKPVRVALAKARGSPSKMKTVGQLVIRESPSYAQSQCSGYDEPLKRPAESLLRSSVGKASPATGLIRKQGYLGDLRSTASHIVSTEQINRSSLEYTPYTLREYAATKPTEYQELGGLGPTVGSEVWKRQKMARDRRTEYARMVQDVNSYRLPGSVLLQQDRDQKMATSTRERGFEFAQKLPKSSRNRADSADY